MSVFRAVKLLLTLRCEQSQRLMAESKQRKLTHVERWAVRLHHLSCSYCRALFRQLKAVDELARGRNKTSDSLSAEARGRIAAEISRRDRA